MRAKSGSRASVGFSFGAAASAPAFVRSAEDGFVSRGGGAEADEGKRASSANCRSTSFSRLARSSLILAVSPFTREILSAPDVTPASRWSVAPIAAANPLAEPKACPHLLHALAARLLTVSQRGQTLRFCGEPQLLQ